MFGRDSRRERLAVPVLAASRRLPVVLFMSISLIFVLLDKAEADAFDEAREAITDVTTPIFETLSPPVMAVREFFGRVFNIFEVYRENERLREENRELLAWKDAALKMEHRLTRLEALMNVQLEPSVGYVTGRVISDTGGPFVRMFIVNAGKRDGVRDNQAVIDEDGLVGRILGAGHKSSRVLLLSDLNSRVPVLVEPSNYRAVLIGDNERDPKLEFLSSAAKVQVGDRVVTSGHDGQMPPGLPVGRVSEVGKNGEIRVQTFSRGDHTEAVRMLSYKFAEPDVLDTPDRAADVSVSEGESPDDGAGE
ncbi:MAG: rod shape-determining protein MreC [Alphaproteobacteria bacterium]|nr:MAG: rod shape-determining protein MreC [Alphaproteobacteria bacterium]